MTWRHRGSAPRLEWQDEDGAESETARPSALVTGPRAATSARASRSAASRRRRPLCGPTLAPCGPDERWHEAPRPLVRLVRLAADERAEHADVLLQRRRGSDDAASLLQELEVDGAALPIRQLSGRGAASSHNSGARPAANRLQLASLVWEMPQRTGRAARKPPQLHAAELPPLVERLKEFLVPLK
jgi:hypothetical protein